MIYTRESGLGRRLNTLVTRYPYATALLCAEINNHALSSVTVLDAQAKL
jgi:hypothetical protein